MKTMNSGLAVCRLIGNLINSTQNIDISTLPSVAEMAMFADKHNLTTMLYPTLKYCEYPEDKLSQLAKKAEQISFYQIKTDALAQKLSEQFTSAEIPHTILKGVEFQKYYPSKLIRKTSDIDFYINSEYKEKSERIITSLGFEFAKCEENSVNFKKKPCYYIELHTDFTAENKIYADVLNEILSDCTTENGYRQSLTDTANLLYAVLHLYKHFVNSGAGVKMLLDIYLIQKSPNIDSKRINKIIKKLELEKFFSAVNSISKYLFDGEKINDDLKSAVVFILNSGTFGSDAFYHQIKVSEIEESHNKRVLKHFLNQFGFSSENIKRKYPFAKKHPITIPYFQIHRVVSGFLHKKETISDVNLRYKSFKNKDEINEVATVMQAMGINNKIK